MPLCGCGWRNKNAKVFLNIIERGWKDMKKTDFGIGLYLMAAIVFLIVPIPSILLDVLLAFNISVAMIILLTALFSREALDMSSFPTLLLFTTIFRISLNVSSTRMIVTVHRVLKAVSENLTHMS